MKSDIEQLMILRAILLGFAGLYVLIIYVWYTQGLHKIIGLLPSIVILGCFFIGLPIVLKKQKSEISNIKFFKKIYRN